MLKDFDFTQVDDRFDNFKRLELGDQLDRLQRIAQGLKIPILVLVDGWESSGKGYIINDLTRELDPRYVRVEVFEEANDIERAHPSVWRFWQKIPSNQEMVFYDRSFYYQVFNYDDRSDKKLEQRVRELSELEQVLIDDGTIVIKLFLNVTHKTQSERINELKASTQKKRLLSKEDIDQNEDYEAHQEWFNKVLEQTNSKFSPWNIIAAEDLKLASKTALGIVIDEIHAGMERIIFARQEEESKNREYLADRAILDEIDLSKDISDEDYDSQLEELQNRAAELVYQYYDKGIAIIVVFEGVDAAGKGGAIKRLTRRIDPRSYKIYGINAPDPVENKFHYLWRFQKELPQDGDMGIFDRSWYGRVLVERVEEFTPERDWERAYNEINQMELNLFEHGSAVMKFFLYIDNHQQAERFQARMENPAKNYKITAEDWRNRDKTPQYLKAMNEMLDRTNTAYAPWYIVPANQKKYARIEVLKLFIQHLENHLE